jgi:hypothetical protein
LEFSWFLSVIGPNSFCAALSRQSAGQRTYRKR